MHCRAGLGWGPCMVSVRGEQEAAGGWREEQRPEGACSPLPSSLQAAPSLDGQGLVCTLTQLPNVTTSQQPVRVTDLAPHGSTTKEC